MRNHETKLRECKALRAGLESGSPTLNEGEGAETVRHRVLNKIQKDSPISAMPKHMAVYARW